MADVSVKPRFRPIIYAWGDFGPDSVTGRWGANTYPDGAVAYIPQDLPDARVAAAYEAAAQKSYKTATCILPSGHFLSERCGDAIKTLTPADAQAALDRMIAEAVEDAARRYTHYCTDCGSVVAVDETGRGSCGHGRVYDIRPNGVDKAIAEAVEAEREACAEIVEKNSEFVRSTDNSRHLQPRSEGDRMALGYANAIRARGEGRDDE